MTWFFIALIGPALWSITNHIDKYLLERFFKGTGPGALLIFSSLIGAFVMPFIPIVERGVLNVTFFQVFLLVLAGVSFLGGIWLYFRALQKDDTSSVVPLFQMIPVWGLVLAWIFLGEMLSVSQIVGAALVIIGAVVISMAIEKRKMRFRWKVFFLMAISAFLDALGGLLFKSVALETG